jgi:acyl-CoA thioester hydrolase
MDAMQHVNNAVYFRYMESARFAYFERIGWTGALESGIGPILGSARCVFKFPLTFPDRVLVGAKVTQIGNDRFTMRHRFYSERHGRIAADGEGVLVAFDYRINKKAELPQVIRQRIAECENGYPPLDD